MPGLHNEILLGNNYNFIVEITHQDPLRGTTKKIIKRPFVIIDSVPPKLARSISYGSRNSFDFGDAILCNGMVERKGNKGANKQRIAEVGGV